MNITEEKLLEYLSKTLVCVAVIVIGYIITRLIIGLLRKILNKSRMDGTAEGFVLSVLKVIFYFIVAVTALGTIGVNVASLITALGAAALTAGLALQDLLKNVVSGLVILINKPFVSGNILDFEGVKGTVEEINIFYGKTRRRLRFPFDDEIRQRLITVVDEMHKMYERRYTPKVKKSKKCNACSLAEICLPRLTRVESVREYLKRNTEGISDEKTT